MSEKYVEVISNQMMYVETNFYYSLVKIVSCKFMVQIIGLVNIWWLTELMLVNRASFEFYPH